MWGCALAPRLLHSLLPCFSGWGNERLGFASHEMAWPITIFIAWMAGKLAHKWVKIPRISIDAAVGFIMAPKQNSLVSTQKSDSILLPANMAYSRHAPGYHQHELREVEMALGLRNTIFSVTLLSLSLPAGSAPTGLSDAPSWHQLDQVQQSILSPLASDWNGLSDDRKLKWLGIASRFPRMTPVEQTRLQNRMESWVKLTPGEREKARLQYKRLRITPTEERSKLGERWQGYSALSDEEKSRLIEKRKITQSAPSVGASGLRGPKALSIAPLRNKQTPKTP